MSDFPLSPTLLARARLLGVVATSALLLPAFADTPADACADGRGVTCAGRAVAPAQMLTRKPTVCPDGTFFVARDGGGCWVCPPGTVRQVTAGDLRSACLSPPGEERRQATQHAAPGGLFGLECPAGQFYDPDGHCYSCPVGFARTAAPVASAEACTRWRKPKSVGAELRAPLVCPDGAERDGEGLCWTCPEGFVRHSQAPLGAADACVAVSPSE